MKILFFVCFVFGLTLTVSAQSKIVTNSDLEKYREQRVKATSDYRENFLKLGFPSPAELDRRNEQNRKDLAQLSVKLRAERIEDERLKTKREANEKRTAPIYYVIDRNRQYSDESYFYSYERYYQRPFRQTSYQNGYFAGGNFWPTPGGVSSPGFGTIWIQRK